jgi:uncharacterized protein DUF6941
MNGVDPFVRHMLLCEGVRKNPKKPNKLDVLGLLNTLTATGSPAFPMRPPVLCVYLEVTAGRGAGQGHIDCRQADSGQLVFSSPNHTVTFPPNPLDIRGLVFRRTNCVLPGPGLHWIQFCYNQKVLAEQPLIVR